MVILFDKDLLYKVLVSLILVVNRRESGGKRRHSKGPETSKRRSRVFGLM